MPANHYQMPDFSAAWAAQLVAAFDGSGVHRVGSAGDFASGEWLMREAAHSGAAVTRMPVPIQRMRLEAAWIECAGQRIDGLPMFDSPPTSGAVTGSLCASGDAGDIAFAEFPSNAASIKGQPLELLRRASSHKAMVIATRGTGESLAPINAQYYDTPFGPPVLQVAGVHHEFLRTHAQRGAAATVLCHHQREAAESYNVAASIASSAQARPLAIVTPRTGWWESTAERAGGIVAWLAGIAAAAALGPRLRQSVQAYATCGHELGHLGLQTLVREQSPLLRDAHYWLHLGANLGGAGNLKMMVRAADSNDAHDMRDLLAAEGYPAEQIHVEPIGRISGEGHDLNHLGAKVLSLAGSNLHFHAASDRWPGNVNAAGIASIARAVARWVALQAG